MDTTPNNMNALFRSYRVAFTDGLQASGQRVDELDLLLDELAMAAPVTGEASVHAWLDAVPRLRKWVGDRIVESLGKGALTVVNDDFESTVNVPRNKVEDDQYGLYTPLVRIMGQQGGSLWLRLVVEALVGGVSAKWADDTTFFLSTRKYGGNTINNKTTNVLSANALSAAILAMESYVGRNDEPMEVAPEYLVVGPKLRDTAWDLVKNQFVIAETGKGGTKQNVLKGRLQLRISRRLVGAYANFWFVTGSQGGIKPVFVQKRKEPVLTALTQEDDENVFWKNNFVYGTHARGASFLTLPHLCYGGIVSA